MNQKNPVLPVEEKTQPTATAKPFDVEAIKAKIPKAFRGYIEPVMLWAESVEQRFKDMEETFPKQIVDELQSRMQARQAEAAAAPVQVVAKPPPPEGGLEQYAPYLLQALGGGEDSNAALTKEILQESLSAMRRKADITDRFMDAIIGNISGKIAGKVVENVNVTGV